MLELLTHSPHPHSAIDFDKIQAEEFEKTIEKALAISKDRIATIEEESSPDFSNIIEALELSSIELDQITTLFFNLYHACTNPSIDAAVAAVSEKLAEHGNNIQLSEKLFNQIKRVYEAKDQLSLNKEQFKLLEETYNGFKRNGALLKPEDKEKLREIDREMASLSPTYSQNLLKATNAFHLNTEDQANVSQLPESVQSMAQEEAKKRGQPGWTFNLQAPSYGPFMKYMPDRELRKSMWMAYNTKALEGEFSNREICQKIAQLRQKRAQLLGYPTHAHFVLEKRMAKSPEHVMEFLGKIKNPALVTAKKELKDLQSFVNNTLKEDIEIQPWDFSYYSEKCKQQLFDLSEEELRPYFPLESVTKGLFLHGEKLYGLSFNKDTSLPTYHEEVTAYEVSKGDQFIGLLYIDTFPRENKKAGAWMTNFREQGFDGKTVHRPHVSIVCNFSRPIGDKPSLLTFYEVQTLFHEFGHALHSLLSDCYYTSLSGTNVLWDFVELPSQIMENWTYELESLKLFAKHYQTQEVIPDDLIEKLNRAKNFQSGYSSLRQVSFSFVDMNWHMDLTDKNLDPIAMEKEATQDIQLLPRIDNTNFSVGFSHIFAGGYSAGYYSYKWAEALDADAFEAFKENGIFDSKTANSFYENVLSRGGVEDPALLYKNFRGRDPDPQALLKRSGLL